MGFTAINASSPPAGSSATPTNNDDAINSAGQKTVASEYLGRGKDRPTTNLSTGNKRSTRGQMRTAPTSGRGKYKRRRTSSVHDDFAPERAPGFPQDGPRLENLTYSAEQSIGVVAGAVGSKVLKPASTLARAIPAYIWATSMDARYSTSTRTSMQTIEANAGRSVTTYQSGSSSCDHLADTGVCRSIDDLATSERLEKVQSLALGQQSTSSMPTYLTNLDKVTSRDMQRSTKSSLHQIDTVSTTRQTDEPKPCRSPPLVSSQMVNDESATAPSQHEPRRSCLRKQSGSTTDTSATLSSHNQQHDGACSYDYYTVGMNHQTHARHEVDDIVKAVEDEDLINSSRYMKQAVERCAPMPLPRARKRSLCEVDEGDDDGDASRQDAKKALVEEASTARDTLARPIVRRPWLAPIQERSYIFGASRETTLRLCFRLGEALNTGSQAVRCNNNIVIELYARVTSSWREPMPERKQHFVFKDLYHGKPPHLEGTFDLWNQSQLWDLDSKPFLRANQDGIKCRTIARMKFEGEKWRLNILNIWEATWEDIDHVAGICSGDIC